MLVSENFRRHEDWGLYDLSIYLGKYRDDAAELVSVRGRAEDNIMHHLLAFIPSVKSFKGRGETKADLYRPNEIRLM